MQEVQIVDVAPRDGLQSEHRILPTDVKVELIRRLAAGGIRELEATSFVNPKKVPQMADAVEVIAGVKAADIDVQQIGLALNVRGAERAIAAGVDEVGFVLVSTDTFSSAIRVLRSAAPLRSGMKSTRCVVRRMFAAMY